MAGKKMTGLLDIDSISKQLIQINDNLKLIIQGSLNSLSSDLEVWEANLVEVPDHEHDHHHQHSIQTHHGKSAYLIPEIRFEIHSELRNNAVQLENRSQSVLNGIKILTQNNSPRIFLNLLK